MADSTSTIKMRVLNTLGSAGVVEVYDRDNNLKDIHFIDERLPGDSPGKILVEGFSKIWNFIQGDKMDINGTRTELEIANISDSDTIKISNHTPTSKLYNNILLSIEFMTIVSDVFEEEAGSSPAPKFPLDKKLLAQNIFKEMIKDLAGNSLKEMSLELSNEVANLLTQVKYTRSLKDLFKGKNWTSRILLLYQNSRDYGLEKISEKAPELLKILPSTAIDTSIESTLKFFKLEDLSKVLKLSSSLAASLNITNRSVSMNKPYSESPIILDKFSMKYYIKDFSEYGVGKIVTYKIFSDGTKILSKETPREMPSYVEEWIMEGSMRVKIRRYPNGTIEKVESSSQGTGQ